MQETQKQHYNKKAQVWISTAALLFSSEESPRFGEQIAMGNKTAVSYFVLSAVPHLHTSMYFLLSHLSFLDICYSSVTVPKMLQNFLVEKKTIFFNGCLSQMSLILLASCTEMFKLSAMAYDRYAAICDPLHYVGTMNKQVCIGLVGGAWLISILYALTNTVPILHLHSCGPNELNNFSCELPSLLEVSCTETFISKMTLLTSAMILGLISFSVTLVSYIFIISTILRISSTEGRLKAFSTCSSHLTVFVLHYGAGLFRYLRPGPAFSMVLDRLFSIQYSILTPMLNPIIYSLRNKEVKAALGKYIAGNERHVNVFQQLEKNIIAKGNY
ncbi:olfactory receptor 5AN6-like [Alligator mississippiensis]|uniref:olfactory receptor 5AN6-like n=1 Tax=Alligator mississippiensis TaxID=8496 RepID=UPI00287730AB|nr:olfactory receptor 5AN6-like [Alligator mississippiensis]